MLGIIILVLNKIKYLINNIFIWKFYPNRTLVLEKLIKDLLLENRKFLLKYKNKNYPGNRRNAAII